MKELLTSRLLLNKINKKDGLDFFNICGNEESTTTFMMQKADSIDEAESMIELIINKYDDKEYIFWAIRLKENNKLIGILLSRESDIIEFGYAIAKDYQNNGYATEVLNRVTDYCLSLNPAKKIVLGTYIDNLASIRVMEKCGYKFYDIKLNGFIYKGKRRDTIYYVKKNIN